MSDEIKLLRSLLEQATAGPWKAETEEGREDELWMIRAESGWVFDGEDRDTHDVPAIAALGTLWPALLLVVEDVEALARTRPADDREAQRLRVCLWQSQGRLKAAIREHLEPDPVCADCHGTGMVRWYGGHGSEGVGYCDRHGSKNHEQT